MEAFAFLSLSRALGWCCVLCVACCPCTSIGALLCARTRLRTRASTRPLLYVPALVPVPVLTPVPVLVHTRPCCIHPYTCTRVRLLTLACTSYPHPPSHSSSYQHLLYPPSSVPVPGPASTTPYPSPYPYPPTRVANRSYRSGTLWQAGHTTTVVARASWAFRCMLSLRPSVRTRSANALTLSCRSSAKLSATCRRRWVWGMGVGGLGFTQRYKYLV